MVTAAVGEVFDVELEEDILQANRRLADGNAKLLRKHGVRAIDVMGAIGSGKTSLIEALVDRVKDKLRVAALDGDVATTIDADLIGRHGVPVVQINTGKECHLDANLVKKALRTLRLDELDVLFIENMAT